MWYNVQNLINLRTKDKKKARFVKKKPTILEYVKAENRPLDIVKGLQQLCIPLLPDLYF